MFKYHTLYLNNEEFKEYVNRLRAPGKSMHGANLSAILELHTVRDVGDYYLKKSMESKSPPNLPVFPKDICEFDDKSC